MLHFPSFLSSEIAFHPLSLTMFIITVYLQSEVQNHTFLVFLLPFPFGALRGRFPSLSLVTRIEEDELLDEDHVHAP